MPSQFYIVFTQLVRKIGVAIGPEDIDPVRNKCAELEEEMRKVAREEARKIALEHTEQVKQILANYTKEVTEGLKPKKKEIAAPVESPLNEA